VIGIAPGAPTGGRLVAPALGLLLLALGALSTWLGADVARQKLAPREVAEETLRLALVEGNDHPEVRASLLEFRSTLGRRPLDSMTRAAYASLLLSLSRDVNDLDSSIFHIRRAVELAPVTIPVVRMGVLVLAHTRNVEPAVALVRSAFEYDAPAAASMLEQIEPLLSDVPIEEALPDRPAAWREWSIRLDRAGRHEEANSVLDRAWGQWPDDLFLLERVSFVAASNGRWERLREYLPPDRTIPDVRQAAALFVHRSRLRAHEGDLDAARSDIEHALRLDGVSPHVGIAAGEAYLAVGDVAGARGQWNAVNFELGPTDTALRRTVLEHIAELEDAHGSPSASLRAWRDLLATDPDHRRARRRIDDLTGFRRGG